jgi:dTDP-4-dehydrorhamnose reductase
MKVLITGAQGQVGKALQTVFADAVAVDRQELDITGAQAVASFDYAGIEAIINTAAYTNVDGAQDPAAHDAVWAVNVTAVQNLVDAAQKHSLPLVHISTDYVFDGSQSEPYSEDDMPNPQSEYAKSKAAGDAIAARYSHHYIVRASWVIGDGTNFVRTMLKLGSTKPEISVVADQKGRPTFANDLAKAIHFLLTHHAPYGTYNVTNDGPVVSWAELAEAVFAAAKLDCKVQALSTAEYAQGKPHFAPRPANSTLNLSKLGKTGMIMPDWREALTEYLQKEQA